MSQKQMLFIFNPAAGRGEIKDYLFQVVDRFTKEGFSVTVHPTQSHRDAFEVALSQGAAYDYLVCSGGDGTLNEVVDALMLMPVRPVLGYLPAGTTNDFAFSLGLPSDIPSAAEIVCSGAPLPIDIGQFQVEYFSYVAAFGLFTDVSYGTSQSLKNMLGHAAYILEGVKRLPFITPHRCTVICDDEEFTDDFIFGMVTNSVSVGGYRLPLPQPNRQGDGAFEVILLKNITSLNELPHIAGVLLGNGKPCDSLIVRTAKQIQINSAEPLDWTLDGEFGGSHQSVNISVHQHALSIMAPGPGLEDI